MRSILLGLGLCFCAGTMLPATREATITPFAGNGTKGSAGDGGPAVAAQLADPGGIARGPDGALYICDTANHKIRRVAPDGSINAFAGTGEKGYSGDGGPATEAKLAEPYEARFDSSGNVYWVERVSQVVRRVDVRTGKIATVAGSGVAGYSGDDGPATSAKLSDPHSICFDAAGDLFVADVRNNRVRKVVMKTGVISTVLGNGKREATPDSAKLGPEVAVAGPRALAFDGNGMLWLALREGNAVLKIDLQKGQVSRVAGNGQKGYAGDGGPAKAAILNGPKGIAAAPDGRIFVADTENHVIRVIDPRDGTIALAVGTGVKGDGPDGDPRQCALNRPHGIFVDKDGAIFIGDTDNYRVRVVR